MSTGTAHRGAVQRRRQPTGENFHHLKMRLDQRGRVDGSHECKRAAAWCQPVVTGNGEVVRKVVLQFHISASLITECGILALSIVANSVQGELTRVYKVINSVCFDITSLNIA